jgi:hypothetical protein
MARDTDIETVRRSDRDGSGKPGAVAVLPSHVTDSRFTSDAATTAAGDPSSRADIGSKGMQFILASWADLYTGLWLIIAPFALTYANHVPRAHANEMIIGALVASMGATRVFGNYRSGRLNQLISALTVLPGIWLVIAPFVLGYSDMVRPTRVDIITGIAVILFALWSWMTSRDDQDEVNRRAV